MLITRSNEKFNIRSVLRAEIRIGVRYYKICPKVNDEIPSMVYFFIPVAYVYIITILSRTVHDACMHICVYVLTYICTHKSIEYCVSIRFGFELIFDVDLIDGVSTYVRFSGVFTNIFWEG